MYTWPGSIQGPWAVQSKRWQMVQRLGYRERGYNNWTLFGSGAVTPGRYRTGWAPIHKATKQQQLRKYNKTNMAAAGGELQSTHRYTLQPPYFTGDHATFEEWTRKMVAYLGLQTQNSHDYYKQQIHPTWRLQTPSLEMEQLHHKKHNFGYNSVEACTTYWSAFVQDKQQYCADSTVHKHRAWRPGGNYTTGSRYQPVHVV